MRKLGMQCGSSQKKETAIHVDQTTLQVPPHPY
jgi:hypothetical protein